MQCRLRKWLLIRSLKICLKLNRGYLLDEFRDAFEVLPRAIVAGLPAGRVYVKIGSRCDRLFSLRRRNMLCRSSGRCCCCCCSIVLRCGHNTCCALCQLVKCLVYCFIYKKKISAEFSPQTLTCYVNICFCLSTRPLGVYVAFWRLAIFSAFV